MSAKNKKNKGVTRQGPYKKFLTDLQEVLHILLGSNKKLSELSNEYLHMLYDYKYVFQNPKAYNEHVTTAELNIINEKSRKLFVEPNVLYKENYLSNYQLHLLWCYLSIKAKEAKRKYGEDDPDYIELKETAKKGSEIFYSRFLIDYFKVITQLSSPDHKYFGIRVRPAAIFKENPKMEIVVEVYGFKPKTTVLEIGGHKRPAFRLAVAKANTTIEWISIETSVLGNHYHGDKKQIEVYIQSHALKRFRERLDVLDTDAVNYLLWENTHTISSLIVYRGFLLQAVKLFDVKIGYLVGSVIDDIFLFSTFLFITHSCSPEGDRLKKITGLGKEDISYWHIDRLSTFINLHEDKYPQLIKLFDEAGMGDIKELKNKKFDIDSLQDANLEALLEYINKNKLTIQSLE
jgi:hypothetical protein